jgi:hypothetical protein
MRNSTSYSLVLMMLLVSSCTKQNNGNTLPNLDLSTPRSAVESEWLAIYNVEEWDAKESPKAIDFKLRNDNPRYWFWSKNFVDTVVSVDDSAAIVYAYEYNNNEQKEPDYVRYDVRRFVEHWIPTGFSSMCDSCGGTAWVGADTCNYCENGWEVFRFYEGLAEHEGR